MNGRTVARDTPADPDVPDRNYRVGGFNDEYFQGLIHDLRIYERALSPTGIRALVK